jgi:hypothetical protein
MKKCLRIANCSGFYGDRISAAREMVEGGSIDVLTGDWLAELTMLILAKNKERPGGKGYATTFITQMREVMATCLQKKIKVVANAGGLDPQGCALAIQGVADELGLKPRIAFVTGDNVLQELGQLGDEVRDFETGEPLSRSTAYISANAYLGGWGIAAALSAGADIVITGRVTDAALVIGPAAWFHDWACDDWDALAGATAAGHVIECGTQATGGNYSFFQEIVGLERPGFPWADVYADGSSVIGKHEGTGGNVTTGTVVSQLLYEIAGPAYANPDVTAQFDTVRVEQLALDRVRLSACRGEPPPATLKVALNEVGGYRNDLTIALTGIDIEAKAALVERAFWHANRYRPLDYKSVTTQLVRTDKSDPASNEEAVALWRLTLKDPDPKKVGRAAFDAASEMALATIPGFFRPGAQGSKVAREYGVYRPATIARRLVQQSVVFLDGEVIAVHELDSERLGRKRGHAPVAASTPVIATQAHTDAPSRRLPLGRLVGARSGDKGGHANLGVFVRNGVAWPWLQAYLTAERLRELLPEAAELRIERHEFPNLLAVNFVIHGLLQEGVAASTRQDGQAKSLGEWLRSRIADIPLSLLEPQAEVAGAAQ